MQAMGNDRLRSLLRDLAVDDRRLLEWRIVDGWHYAGIAVHLGVPRNVLADRVHRLRTDVRRKAKAVGAMGKGGGRRWR
jgi:DNA-directed RNA polymerase specialized sigma24 family protein